MKNEAKVKMIHIKTYKSHLERKSRAAAKYNAVPNEDDKAMRLPRKASGYLLSPFSVVNVVSRDTMIPPAIPITAPDASSKSTGRPMIILATMITKLAMLANTKALGREVMANAMPNTVHICA
mmetsp:Transcript_32815/g.35383  ORF Transcript_32815/g.35383 Transcript_32815/m.35383 type:complete len:123 (+) Transcript_32815:610-978(+)